MSFSDKELDQMSATPQKGDFKLKYTPDSGDENPPPVHSVPQGMGGAPGMPPENATAKALEGFFKMIDIGLTFTARMSKGTIEYEGCTKDEIEMMAEQGSKSEQIAALAAMENMPTWMTIGIAAGTYVKHVKLKKKEKPEEPKLPTGPVMTENEANLITSLAKKKVNAAKQVPQISVADAENENLAPVDKSALEIIQTQGDEYLSAAEKKAKELLTAASEVTPEQLKNMKMLARANSIKIAAAEKQAKVNAAANGVHILD